MTYTSTTIARLVLVVLVAAILAPAAFAEGGVTVRTTAPPPLDAGSALPNPDYSIQSVRPDDRASRPSVHGTAARAVVVKATGDGFDWGDAGIGAAGTIVFVLIGIAPVLVLRESHRRFVRG